VHFNHYVYYYEKRVVVISYPISVILTYWCYSCHQFATWKVQMLISVLVATLLIWSTNQPPKPNQRTNDATC